MNNMNWTTELTGQNQEARDRTIETKWGVRTPYVMFSRHHWMPGMPIPRPRRFTEMMVYTQTHRALIDVVTLMDTQTAQLAKTNRIPVPFRQQIKNWKITVPADTRNEFKQRGETELYKLSA